MNLNDPASPRDVVNGDDLVPPHVTELILSFPEVQKILENDQEQFDKWIEQIAFPSWFLNALKTLSHGEAMCFGERGLGTCDGGSKLTLVQWGDKVMGVLVMISSTAF